MTTMMILLAFAAQDRAVQITEEYIDTVIYENLAVTRVRLTVANNDAARAREFAATLRVPADAVAFEFDGYGTVQGDNQASFDPEIALSLYMQLVDAARRQGLNSNGAAISDGDKASDDLVRQTNDRLKQLVAGTVDMSVTVSNTDAGLTVQDHGQDVAQQAPPREPELLQQIGPGEFQVVVFPIPARSKQHIEIYFASKAAEEAPGIYTWEMPTELKAFEQPAERLIHVRVVSAGEVKELKSPSHKNAREEDHAGKNRREVRISGRSALGAEPVKVRYVVGDGARPADVGAFEAAEPAWPEWDKKKTADPVMAPERAYAALKTRHTIDAMMADKASPLFDREKNAAKLALDAKIVTPYSSLILSEAILYKFIGAEVPPGKEVPYKSIK